MVTFSDELIKDIGEEMGAVIQYLFEINSELNNLRSDVLDEFSGSGRDALLECIEELIRLFEGRFNIFLDNYKSDLNKLAQEFDKLDSEISAKINLSN